MKLKKISITFESEKLSAIRMFIPDNSPGVEEQLTEQLEKLYEKIVPAPVRQYILAREKKPVATNKVQK